MFARSTMTRLVPAEPARRSERSQLADTAAAVADMIAQTIGAAGAAILIENEDRAEALCAVGALGSSDRPAPAPFMLAMDGEPFEWRAAQDGSDLLLRRAIDDGTCLLFFARCQHMDSAAAAAALTLAPALDTLAAMIAAERGTARRLASYQAALERSELAIILLARDGAVLFANSNAARMLDQGDLLRRRGDGIGARDLADAMRLEIAIDHVRSQSEGAVEDPVVVLKRPRMRPLFVCISPAGVEAGHCDAAAILRIIDPERDPLTAIEPVCSHYRLSPVETRLAGQLARGLTIEEAAALLRIKPQTARSYLKQIFLKTDTNRQSELVRLLLTSTVRALPAGRFRLV